MLKAFSVYNVKLIRAMQIQELKRYLKYIGADLVLNIAVLAVLFRSGGFSVCRWLFCGLLLLQIAVVADLFYFSAARRYRAAGEGKDLRMEFTVSETGLDIVMKGEAFTAVASAPFDSISKAVETASFIFIYQNRLLSYIIDQAALPAEAAEALRQRLAAALEGRYIVKGQKRKRSAE